MSKEERRRDEKEFAGMWEFVAKRVEQLKNELVL